MPATNYLLKRCLPFLALLVAALLTACGAAATPTSPGSGDTAPVAEDSTGSTTLPMFPEAKAFPSGSPMATAVDSMKAQLSKDQTNAKVDVYELPASTGFDAVKTFYETELNKQGYTAAATNEQMAQAKTAAWTKGSDAVVTVSVMDNPTGGPILLIAQATP